MEKALTADASSCRSVRSKAISFIKTCVTKKLKKNLSLYNNSVLGWRGVLAVVYWNECAQGQFNSFIVRSDSGEKWSLIRIPLLIARHFYFSRASFYRVFMGEGETVHFHWNSFTIGSMITTLKSNICFSKTLKLQKTSRRKWSVSNTLHTLKPLRDTQMHKKLIRNHRERWICLFNNCKLRYLQDTAFTLFKVDTLPYNVVMEVDNMLTELNMVSVPRLSQSKCFVFIFLFIFRTGLYIIQTMESVLLSFECLIKLFSIVKYHAHTHTPHHTFSFGTQNKAK